MLFQIYYIVGSFDMPKQCGINKKNEFAFGKYMSEFCKMTMRGYFEIITRILCIVPAMWALWLQRTSSNLTQSLQTALIMKNK